MKSPLRLLISGLGLAFCLLASGCASTAVVPRSLAEVETRVQYVWGPRHRMEWPSSSKIQLPDGGIVQYHGVPEGLLVDSRSPRDRTGIWEDFSSGVELTTLRKTDREIAWRVEQKNLQATLQWPLGHAVIEASRVDENQTRIRVKTWDNKIFYNSRNYSRGRKMLERLTQEP